MPGDAAAPVGRAPPRPVRPRRRSRPWRPAACGCWPAFADDPERPVGRARLLDRRRAGRARWRPTAGEARDRRRTPTIPADVRGPGRPPRPTPPALVVRRRPPHLRRPRRRGPTGWPATCSALDRRRARGRSSPCCCPAATRWSRRCWPCRRPAPPTCPLDPDLPADRLGRGARRRPARWRSSPSTARRRPRLAGDGVPRGRPRRPRHRGRRSPAATAAPGHRRRPAARRCTPDHPAYVIFTSGSTGPAQGRGRRPPQRASPCWPTTGARLFAPDRRAAGPAAADRPRLAVLVRRLVAAAARPARRPRRPRRRRRGAPRPRPARRDDRRRRASTSSRSRRRTSASSPRPGCWPTAACPSPCSAWAARRCPPPLWAELQGLDGTEAYNFYGPTECTVDTVVGRVRDSDRPVIGRPVDGTTAYVLDAGLRPVLPGVAGELYLGRPPAGPRLPRPARPDRRAVRGRPVRAARRPHVPHRRPGPPRRRRHHRVRRPGRRPGQDARLPHRAGEIEAALATPPRRRPGDRGRPRPTRPGVTRLVAYVVPAAGPADGRRPGRRACGPTAADRLPDYMVPAAVVVLDALPAHRQRQARPRGAARPRLRRPGGRGRRPATDREAAARRPVRPGARACPRVGIDDGFFDLGGDSIVSMQLVSLAREAGLVFTPREVFRHRTVAALAPGRPRRPTTSSVEDDGRRRRRGRAHADRRTGCASWAARSTASTRSCCCRRRRRCASTRWPPPSQAVLDRHDVLRSAPASAARRPGAWTLDVPPGRRRRRRRLRHPGRRRRPEADDAVAEAVARWQQAGGRARPRRRRAWCGPCGSTPARPSRAACCSSPTTSSPTACRGGCSARPGRRLGGRRRRRARPTWPPVGTSFRRWSQLLHDEARAPGRVAELGLLARHARRPAGRRWAPARSTRPRDTVATERHARRAGAAGGHRARCSPGSPARYQATIDEVLLTALAAAVADWRRARGEPDAPGADAVLVDLEGHGREEVVGGADLSRTVGWFTSALPGPPRHRRRRPRRRPAGGAAARRPGRAHAGARSGPCPTAASATACCATSTPTPRPSCAGRPAPAGAVQLPRPVRRRRAGRRLGAGARGRRVRRRHRPRHAPVAARRAQRRDRRRPGRPRAAGHLVVAGRAC